MGVTWSCRAKCCVRLMSSSVLLNSLPQSVDGRRAARRSWIGGGVIAATAAMAGCAQPPGQHSSASNSKEYFSSSIYGPASPRVVADGEAVPRGGGQYLVGRPYTIAGKTYYPSEKTNGYSAVGTASWYGDAFHGRRTANGEVYDKASISAAHPTMPLPSYARVTNLRNHYSIIVRVNDRGPYHGGRVMDVSQRVAEALDFKHLGTAKVQVDYVGKAGLEGSDDQTLLASLRTDGNVASLNGVPTLAPILVASRTFAPARAELEQSTESTALAAAAPLRATAEFPAHGPLPPARPFDLGAIRRMVVAPASSAQVAMRSSAPATAPAARMRVPRAAMSGTESLN
jgi:rare lipoprotein A